MAENNKIYLGDEVYVDYDGYHILLAVNHHDNVVVCLNHEVMDRLIAYNEDLLLRGEFQQAAQEVNDSLEQ